MNFNETTRLASNAAACTSDSMKPDTVDVMKCYIYNSFQIESDNINTLYTIRIKQSLSMALLFQHCKEHFNLLEGRMKNLQTSNSTLLLE